jgi:MYXO-CTERM domain-containing protein
MNKLHAIPAVLVAALAATANAQLWTETGDADGVIGQMTSGGGALSNISGSLSASDREDMYRIHISNPAVFSATAVGGASFDTQMFLFLPSIFGTYGVTMNDDSAGGVQSTITGMFVPGPGDYLLAISSYDNDPISALGAIWNDTPYATERFPDGPGQIMPLMGWDGAGGATGSSYRLTLTGAEFAQAPTPGSLALLGCGGLASLRRRRR